MKIASWIMFAIFGLSVVVQANDPDPVIWMILYGAAAALSLLAALDRNALWPTGITLVVLPTGYSLPLSLLPRHFS